MRIKRFKKSAFRGEYYYGCSPGAFLRLAARLRGKSEFIEYFVLRGFGLITEPRISSRVFTGQLLLDFQQAAASTGLFSGRLWLQAISRFEVIVMSSGRLRTIRVRRSDTSL